MVARFEALYMGVLTAASDLSCNFLRILTSGFEQCDPLELAHWPSLTLQICPQS